MKDKESENLAYASFWKVTTCSQGEKCWYREVKPLEPIMYINEDGIEQEYTVINAGSIESKLAKHIVDLHNVYILNKT